MKQNSNTPIRRSRRFGWPLLVAVFTALLLASCFSALPPRVELFFNWPAEDEFGFADKSALWSVPAIVLGAIYVLHLIRAPMIKHQVSTERQARQRMISVRFLNLLALAIAFGGLLLVSASIGAALFNWQNLETLLYPALPILFVLLPMLAFAKRQP